VSDLREHAFSDLYEMSSGISSTPAQAGHGAPFLSFSTVFNNYFLPEVLPDLMNTSEFEQESYSVKEGDIFLTRTSETVDELGMSSVSLKDYPGATFSGFLKRLRPRAVGRTDPRFMAFYLRSPLFRKTMTNNAVMVLRASLNEQIFSYLKLLLPDFGTQTSIGEFLHLLSTKVDLNNRTNTELEALAKTIYDYWFVQFDFPDTKGRPYKTSGGDMVWNEALKRKIPSGWVAGALGDMLSMERGVTYGKEDLRSFADPSAFGVLRATNVNGNTIDLDDLVHINAQKVASEQKISAFETLIVMSSGSKEHVGKNGIYYFKESVAFGAFCSKIVPDIQTRWYVGTLLQTGQFKSYISNQCLGTNINNLRNDHICSFPIAKPSDAIALHFEETVAPLYMRIANNTNENRELTQLRDWVLPLLMNGQVSVTC